MAVSILIAAVAAFLLGSLDCAVLVSRLFLGGDIRQSGGSSYAHVLKAHGYLGAGYVFVADLIKTMVTVLIGGLLLKGAGFPSVGKLTAMLFALVGQAMPFADRTQKREGLIVPALLLLWVDWRLCLICVIVGLLTLVFTGDRSLAALAVGVAFPAFTAILGGWWLKILLALLCSAALLVVYREGLRRRLAPRAAKRPAPGREQGGDDTGER